MNFSHTVMQKTRLAAMVFLGAVMSCQYFAERYQQAEEAKVLQPAAKQEAPDFPKEALEALNTIMGFTSRKGLTQDMIAMYFDSREIYVHNEGIGITVYKPNERIFTKVISPALSAWDKGVEGRVFRTDTGSIGYIRRGNQGVYFAETPNGTLTMRFNPDNGHKPEVINQSTGETEEWKTFAPYYHKIEEEEGKRKNFAFLDFYKKRTRTVDIYDEYCEYNSDEVNKKAEAREEAYLKAKEAKRTEEFRSYLDELNRKKQMERNQVRRKYLDLSKKLAAWTFMALLAATGLSTLVKKKRLPDKGQER